MKWDDWYMLACVGIPALVGCALAAYVFWDELIKPTAREWMEKQGKG